MWVDSHCHLHHAKVKPDEVPGMIDRAHQASVTTMLTVSTCLDDTARIFPLLQAYPHVYGSVGIHPHEADATLAQHSMEHVAALLKRDATSHPKILALGETGLDFYYGHSDVHHQLSLFHLHMRLGAELNLPVIIHTRDAEEATLEVLKTYQGQVRGVLHCFTGSWQLAEAALGLGYYLSCSGIITFPKTSDLRQTFTQAPINRILIETDAPYLAPVPYRGRPNEPAYMASTGQVLADLHQMSLEAMAQQTTQNFWTLMGKTPTSL